MRKINKILIGIILIAVMFLGIGYSAINNITLNITGTVSATSPYIPKGFSEVEGTSFETGYTIQDSKGNQYVWVEVPHTTEVYKTTGIDVDLTGSAAYGYYGKIYDDLNDYSSTYNGILQSESEDQLSDSYNAAEGAGLSYGDYMSLYYKMLSSIYKNGGFYVGKYETGIENTPKTSGASSTAPTETPVIKRRAYPYNFVTCSQAQTLASGMDSGEFTSSLMFNVQWNLILKYLETKAVEQGTDLETIQAKLKTDSSSWGNLKNNLWYLPNPSYGNYALQSSGYKTWNSSAYKKTTASSAMLTTGALSSFQKQGIYDLAGNVWEWTLGYYNDENKPEYHCCLRGNACDGTSPVYWRSPGMATSLGWWTGFRVVIF